MTVPTVKEKILIVEDNELSRQLLGLTIQKLGYVAIFAFNGKEAVKQFEMREVALIFMDVEMPEKNGIAATREIRALEKTSALPEIPIIGYTSSPEVYSKVGFEAGMNDCLKKPSSGAVIKGILEKYLRGSLTKSH